MDHRLYDETVAKIAKDLAGTGRNPGDFLLYTVLPDPASVPKGQEVIDVGTPASNITLGDILHDPVVRESVHALPGSLFLTRVFAADGGVADLRGLDEMLDSSVGLGSFLERVLVPKTNQAPDSKQVFVSDVHPHVAFSEDVRKQLQEMPVNDDLVWDVEFLGSQMEGTLSTDLAVVVSHLTDEQKAGYFKRQDAKWQQLARINAEVLPRVREDFREHRAVDRTPAKGKVPTSLDVIARKPRQGESPYQYFTFADYNRALSAITWSTGIEGEKYNFLNFRWQVARYLRFAGCPPRASVEPSQSFPWNLLEWCRGILCRPENVPLVAAIHDILGEAGAAGLFSFKFQEEDPTSNDLLRYNRYLQPDRVSYREKANSEIEDDLDRLGTRVTKCLVDLRAFFTEVYPQWAQKVKAGRGAKKRPRHAGQWAIKDGAGQFRDWCQKQKKPDWLPSPFSMETRWTATGLRGHTVFHRKLLHYVGGRLEKFREYAGLGRNAAMGSLPPDLEKNVFDLYLFYLELSFLLGLPTMSKGGVLAANLEKVTKNLRVILLGGRVVEGLGNVAGGISDTLAKVGNPADRQHLNAVFEYFKSKRELERKTMQKQGDEQDQGKPQERGKSEESAPNPVQGMPSAVFKILELVEACRESSDQYPALLSELFSKASYTAEELTEQQKLAEQRKMAAAERAKAGKALTEKHRENERRAEGNFACVKFIAELFANPDIQQAMRRCCNLGGLLGHLYRTHLFHLPPAVPDCDPFPELRPVTLAEAAAFQADIKGHASVASAGSKAGSKCRVMPDFSFKLEGDKSVKDYLQALAAARQNREIYYLGWRAANWRVSAHALNCMRVAATYASKPDEEAEAAVPGALRATLGKDIMNMLRRTGQEAGKQRTKSAAENAMVDRAIQQALANDPLSFAAWALTASLSEEAREGAKKDLRGTKVRRGAVPDRSRSYRNLHDLSEVADWPDLGKRDDVNSYPAVLGKYLNRRKFYPRWKGFARLVKDILVTKTGTETAEQLMTRLRVSQDAKDFMLLYYIPIAALVPASGASDTMLPLDEVTGVVSRPTADKIRSFQTALVENKILKDTARRFVQLYPSYLDYFLGQTGPGIKSGKDNSSGKGDSGKKKTPPPRVTPAALVSAAFKALVKGYEDRLAALSEKDAKGTKAKRYRDLISKCVRAIYAHEYVAANSRVEQVKQEDGSSKEVKTALRKALDAASLPPRGLSFLALIPAILPRSKFVGRFADLGHSLLNLPVVADHALVGPALAAETHANPNFFSRGYRDLRDVVTTAIQVLAALRVSAPADGDLGALLHNFVTTSDAWWDYRCRRVVHEWAKAEDVLEEGVKTPEAPEGKDAPLKHIALYGLLEDGEKLRKNRTGAKKVIPLSLSTGKESVGNIRELSEWTRDLSREEDPSDVIQFSLKGFPFEGEGAIDENLFNFKPDVLFTPGIRDHKAHVTAWKTVTGALPNKIKALQAKITNLEEQREKARVLDYRFKAQLAALAPLLSRRGVVTDFLVEKNRLKTRRAGFEGEKGDLAQVNLRLEELDPPQSKLEDEREVKGIRPSWDAMNALLQQKQEKRSQLKQKEVNLGVLDLFLDGIFDRPGKSVEAEYENLVIFASARGMGPRTLPKNLLKEYLEITQRQVELERAIPARVREAVVLQGEETACQQFLYDEQEAIKNLGLGIDVGDFKKDVPESQGRFEDFKQELPNPGDACEALRKLLNDFVAEVRPSITDLHAQVDAWAAILARAGKKKKDPKGRQDFSTDRRAAWDVLAKDPLFTTFIRMDRFPCKLRLPKPLLAKFRKKNGGAQVTSIRLLPPQLPHKHVIANVAITGPKDTVSPVPSFVEKLAKLVRKSGKNVHAIGVDNNRLNCRRTFAFGATDKGGKPVSLEKEDRPSDKEYALLADTFDHKVNQVNDRNGNLSEFWDGRSFGTRSTDPRFSSAFRGKFLPEEKPSYPIPASATPFQVRSARHDWTFSDYLAAPAYYWASARVPLGQVVRGCAAKRRKIDTKTKGKLAPSQDRQRQRLRTEMRCADARAETLRGAAVNYWVRVLCYVILRFQPKLLAYEKLRFNPWGKQGGLGQIIAGMVKNFADAIQQVETWLERAKVPYSCKERVEAVKASGTSQEGVDDAGNTGPVERRASSDWIWFLPPTATADEDPPGIIVDAHVTSGVNIARRHPKMGQEIPDPNAAQTMLLNILLERLAHACGHEKKGDVWWWS